MKKVFMALAALLVVPMLVADTQSEWYSSLSNRREATEVVVGNERWCPSVYKDQALPYRFACGAVLNSTVGGKRLDLNNVTISEGEIWANGDLAILLTGNNYVSGDISSNWGNAYYSLLLFGSGALTVNSSYTGIACGGLSICAGPSVTIINGGVEVVGTGKVLISMSSVLIRSPGNGIFGGKIDILGSAVAIHSGSISLGSGGASNIVIDGSVVSIMNDTSWRGVWADVFSVSHSYFSCVVPRDGWGCICASQIFFDNSIAKLYSKKSPPLNDECVGNVVFGEGDYYIASGSQVYAVGVDGMAVKGGNVQICSAGDGSSAVDVQNFQIDSGRLEIVDKIDVRGFLKFDAAAAALYTGVVADGTIDVSSFMANFYSQVILDAISNAKIGNLNGVPNVGISCGGSSYSAYTQNGGTVWCDLAKYGIMCYSPVINGGSYKGQFYSPEYSWTVPLNSSGDSLKNVQYTVSGVKKYDKITQSWSGILPSYYGTGSLYADAASKLYFWVPEQWNVSGGGSGGGADPANKPDLVPYTPTGWDSPVVVAKDEFSTTDAIGITANDNLYLQFAVICRGVDVTAKICFTLYVDGVEKTSWYYEGHLLENDYVHNVSAYALGKLSAGTHTFKLVADSAGAVAESNEGNNVYVKTVTVRVPSYVVTFNANGGMGSTSRTVESGKVVGVLPMPTRSGYTFVGWFTAASGGTKVLATTTVSGNVTFYAQWKRNDAYTLSGAYAADKARVLPGATYNASTAAGVLSLKIGKANKKGVFKVSGSLTTADGKKHSLRTTAATVTGGFVTVNNIAVNGVGTLTLKLAANGFTGVFSNGWTARTANIANLRKGDVTFALAPYPTSIRGVPVKTEYLPLKLKGNSDGVKIVFPKAGRVSYRKNRFEVSKGGEGNPSALKLTLSPKTGVVKGSFRVYTFNGRTLKGNTAKIFGFLVDGKVYMSVTVPGITFDLPLQATLESAISQ